MWFARPSTYETFIHNTLPVFNRRTENTMRSQTEIEAAQAKLVAVKAGTVNMPDEFNSQENRFKLACFGVEMNRILSHPGEDLDARRALIRELLDELIVASPQTKAALKAYHSGEEAVLPNWLVLLTAKLNVLDWAQGDKDGDGFAGNLSMIDAALATRSWQRDHTKNVWRRNL